MLIVLVAAAATAVSKQDPSAWLQGAALLVVLLHFLRTSYVLLLSFVDPTTFVWQRARESAYQVDKLSKKGRAS